MTRMPILHRSLATGSVRLTTAPFDEAYAAWPICWGEGVGLVALVSRSKSGKVVGVNMQLQERAQ